jgi:hypothetical protein
VFIILLAAAAVVTLVPLVCLVLVSVASLREDHTHSLGYRPAGSVQAAARRIIGFYGSADDGSHGNRDHRRGDEFGDDGGFHGDGGFPPEDDDPEHLGWLDSQRDLRDLVG